MVLVLTHHQLAINFAACKSSILALTFLAVEDMSVDFLELLQECSLPALGDIRYSNFFIPMSIGCTRDVVLGDRNASWIFFKESK
jgi:hypothetical protein